MSDSRLQTANLKRSYVGKQKRQSGVALFISLVMLLILTVLGLSSVQTTSVQERMARNARDTNLAFQGGRVGPQRCGSLNRNLQFPRNVYGPRCE